jgi:hypothetical protein
MLDERRNGGPQLRAFQEDFLSRIDRRKAAVSRDPRYIEQHNWTGYLNELSGAQKQRWQNYRQRLLSDPAATFDVDGGRA